MNRNYFFKGPSKITKPEWRIKNSNSVFWLEAWQEITSQIKISSQPAIEGGVWGVDLASCEENQAENLIILGSVEERKPTSVVNGLDREKLSFISQLGFDLNPLSKILTTAEFEWLNSGGAKKKYNHKLRQDRFSSGRSIAASPLWVKKASIEKKGCRFSKLSP